MTGTPLWVVAGAPGAGKSTVARALVARLNPSPALLDKDTMYESFVIATLDAAGRPHREREGRWYDEHVKRHEYSGMTDTACEIRRSGCPVVLCAPFTGQIRDPRRWSTWVHELGGDPVRLLWVRIDEETLAQRIRARGHDKDAGKLDNWSAFVERMQPTTPPPVEHDVIDNASGAPDLDVQLKALVSRFR